jgi:signal transduction histidine kinase/ligand-binding sensor protein
MAIDTEKYLDLRNPQKPLALFPEDALVRLLDGFCFYLHAGVTLLFPEPVIDNLGWPQEHATPIHRFQRLEASGTQAHHHPFCRLFRTCPAYDLKCRICDAEKAYEFWRSVEKGPEKYLCHMGVTDMVYPLRLRGQTVGVIFAGQLLTEDGLATVGDRINELVERPERERLKALLSDRTRCPLRKKQEVDQIYVNFVAFGQMLQGLLDRLYDQRWEAARREFLNDVVRDLSPAVQGDESPDPLPGILDSFLKLTSLGAIKVYRRKQSRFEIFAASPASARPDEEGEGHIPARCVVPLPHSSLTTTDYLRSRGLSADDLWQLQEKLSFPRTEVSLFLHKYRAQPTLPLDVLIVLSGCIAQADADRQFVMDFCETLAMRVQVLSLISVLQEERDRFAERVGHVGHTAKTPLQMAVFALESLKSDLSSPDLRRQLDDCERNIMIAKGYIREIYAAPDLRGREKRLRILLESVIQQAGDLAQERGCRINFRVSLTYDPAVRDQGTLSIVFSNLLDNATKYSNPGGTVAVRLKSLGEDTTLVEFENSGQGIPESHIDQVRESHVRWMPNALPEDLRRRRQGEGLGLPMAIQYVENHGGWLDIRSYPESAAYAREPLNHWRTCVAVALPVAKWIG